MSTQPRAAAIWTTIGLLGILIGGPGRAQTVIIGSPIPAPIPVNPYTGHSLRHDRSGIRTIPKARYYQRQRLSPRAARGRRRYYREAVAPGFGYCGACVRRRTLPIDGRNYQHRRDRGRRGRVIIIRGGRSTLAIE